MATSTTQGTGVVLGFESTHAAAATYEKWVRYPNMIVPELQLRVLDESSAHDLVLMDGRYELGPHVAWPYSSSSPSQSSTLQFFHDQVSASGPPLRRDTSKPHHVRRGASTATGGAYFHSRTVLGNAIC